jgi:hypothetical protein
MTYLLAQHNAFDKVKKRLFPVTVNRQMVKVKIIFEDRCPVKIYEIVVDGFSS